MARRKRPLVLDQAPRLPPEAQQVLLRLLSVVKANGLSLVPDMLDEIEAIAVEGADPTWQIAQMRAILDRWAPRH